MPQRISGTEKAANVYCDASAVRLAARASELDVFTVFNCQH